MKGTLAGTVNGESSRVADVLVKNFSTGLAFPTAVVWDGTDLPIAESDAEWDQLVTTLKADAAINAVNDSSQLTQTGVTPGWHVAFLALHAKDYPGAGEWIPHIRDLLQKVPLTGKFRPQVTGGPALFIDMNEASTTALRHGEWFALPITLFILVVVFRSMVASVLPILVALLGVVLTLGVLREFSVLHTYGFFPQMTMTFFVPNLVTMLGLGVGIDYCLIFLARYRREKEHTTTQEALRLTWATAGKTVIVSAVLVMSGFVSLLLVPMECFNSIAIGGVMVVASVAFATLTLLPAIILVLGRRLEWGQVQVGMSQENSQGLAKMWARSVVRRPWIFFLCGLFLLDLLAYPVFGLKVAAIRVGNLPIGTEARQGYDNLTLHLGKGLLLPIVVLIQHPDGNWMGMEQLNQENVLVNKLKALKDTLNVLSTSDASGTRHQQQLRYGLLTSNKDPSQELMLILCRIDPESPEARAWLVNIQTILRQEEVTSPHTTYLMGGLPTLTMESDNIIFSALPKVVAATLLTTFLLLVFFMRAVLVPLKAICLNLLCVLATYGFLVFCYQTEIGHIITRLPEAGGINSFVLVICFCALFGLSMDYEVFILAAVRESWLDTHNINFSIEEGLRRTAGIITSAAVIMISVFMCFAFVGVVETQQLGIGLSFAVFLDATIIRLLCVPSAMALMGKWNFWLPFRKARHHGPLKTPH
jgi:RND superfamily putative drug exporter